MKHSSVAFCLGVWLLACSGERNESTGNLGTGRRDAAADADDSSDAAEDGEDASDRGEPDTGSAEADASGDGGATNDAGAMDAGGGDAASDASAQSDTSTQADTSVQGDSSTQSDASTQNDAGDQLRVRLINGGQPVANAPIVFSQSDGTLISQHTTDAAGSFSSATAPGMITIFLPGEFGNLDSREQVLTVVAPALGDFIDIDMPQGGGTQRIPYELVPSAPPAGVYTVDAYAGPDGCARGYKEYEPPSTEPLLVGARPWCPVAAGDTALLLGRDSDGFIDFYAGATLPAPGSTSPVQVPVTSWLAAEELGVSLANAPVGQGRSALWLRKGVLRVNVDDTNDLTGQYRYPIVRSLVDAFDIDVWTAGTTGDNTHQFRKSVPSTSASPIAFDYANHLVEVESHSFDTTTRLRPKLSWQLVGDVAMQGDAVETAVSWSWQPNSDTVAYLTWRFLAPPGTQSVTVPALPSTGILGQPFAPNDANMAFEGVVYYDSDQQSGLRDFLKEPLRMEDQLGQYRVTFTRALTTNANLRAVVYTAAGT